MNRPLSALLSAMTMGVIISAPALAEIKSVNLPAGTKSTDLNRDLKKMWATEHLNNGNAFCSTDSAIAAADRVFNTVSLLGKTSEEVIQLLGDPRKTSNSQYNFPFYPPAKGALVYRFDCGTYGWQFDVIFDRHGKVRKIERRWIQ